MASWRRKVERAEHHLRDLSERIGPIEQNHLYAVTEALEHHGESEAYIHRINIPEAEDPILPIIAGELMFNLRSALDHLAVAMVAPDDRSRRTAFPIFTDDIQETNPSTGDYLQGQPRETWKRITAGFPEGAMPIVEWVQPYNHRRIGLDPNNTSLARLAAYQNADKHRQLMIVPSGVRDLQARFVRADGRVDPIDHPPIPEGFMVGNRAPVGITLDPLPADVKVEAEGTLTVQIGDSETGDYVPCVETLGEMIKDTTGVLDLLEEFAIHAPLPFRAYTETDHL